MAWRAVLPDGTVVESSGLSDDFAVEREFVWQLAATSVQVGPTWPAYPPSSDEGQLTALLLALASLGRSGDWYQMRLEGATRPDFGSPAAAGLVF